MKANIADAPRRVGFVEAALYVVLMGLLIAWASFYAMPVAVGWEVPEPVIDRIPYAGLSIGAILGLAMAFAKRIRQFVWFLFGVIVAGFLLWLFVVTVAGLGVTLILDGDRLDQTMDQISTITFWLVVLGACIAVAVGTFALLQDKTSALLEPFRPKPPKTR